MSILVVEEELIVKEIHYASVFSTIPGYCEIHYNLQNKDVLLCFTLFFIGICHILFLFNHIIKIIFIIVFIFSVSVITIWCTFKFIYCLIIFANNFLATHQATMVKDCQDFAFAVQALCMN